MQAEWLPSHIFTSPSLALFVKRLDTPFGLQEQGMSKLSWTAAEPNAELFEGVPANKEIH